jgi:glycosyltransferase involved in cell wall biosynthesis
VLLQGYPNLEYIVIDGGSTDNSVEIIKKYEPWLSYWVSEPDQGQVDAINKGLQRVTGQWFNWINGDDILLSGSLKTWLPYLTFIQKLTGLLEQAYSSQ